MRLALLLVALTACGGAPAPSSRSVLRQIHDRQATPAAVSILPADASKVTFARIAKFPEPGQDLPRGFQHAPDGKTVTYLASETGDEVMSLFAFDHATGKSDVVLRARDLGDTGVRSREEELRRERQRERAEGITSHHWAKRANVLVVPHAGDVFVRDAAGAIKRLTKTTEAEIDAKVCDTGERVGFVRKGELFAVDVATGKETALTKPAGEGLTHGLSDYVAQEELGEPSGYFWSPRCDRLVYLEVDERPVAKIPVLGWRGDNDLMMQRYPRAGAANPVVRAGVLDLATRTTKWLTVPYPYLGRFTWSDDGKSLFFQGMTRDQKKVVLLRVDPVTGATTELATETSPAWVTFSPMRALAGERLLFTSTKTGHRHLELRSQRDGALAATLTSGPWDVEGIAGVDEAAGRVLFTATKESPLERQLYAVALAGGEPTRLTPERGVHAVRVNEGGTAFVDVHSATGRPPAVQIVQDGKRTPLPTRVDPEIASLGLRPVEHVTVTAADGEVLHGALLKPRVVTGRHPVVVMVYGGPETQLVYDTWSPHLLWQHLADRGFVVFQLDNRGSGGRGRGASQKVHKQLGKLELEDQIAGARWLAQQPYVDGARIGIYGHSYGGYMAALAMLDGKGVFKAGVAGSPVTDWSLYDTGYTERFMETPATNAAGYEASDLTRKAAGLTGSLLLMHAQMDENVHYAHTAKLIDALVAADKRFDLLVLPGERHGLRAPAAKVYVPERVVGYFVEKL